LWKAGEFDYRRNGPAELCSWWACGKMIGRVPAIFAIQGKNLKIHNYLAVSKIIPTFAA
jgi:hypothetical protein